jgi:YD repeat-containing protein
MKPKLTLLLFSATLLIFSCSKKNDPDNVGPCLPLIMITKVSGVTNLDGKGIKAVNMVFTYDAANYLVKIKDGQKTTKFTYDKDNRFIFEVEHADSAVSPVQRQIFKALSMTDTGPLQVFEYHYEGNQLVFESANEYSYTGGFVSEVKRTSGNGVVTQKYTFMSGNMVAFDNGIGTVYRYKYDSKRNPFVNRFTRYQTGPVDFSSANLVTDIEEETNGSKKTNKRVYTYNQDGHPLTVKSVNNEGTITLDLKFEYDEFVRGCY